MKEELKVELEIKQALKEEKNKNIKEQTSHLEKINKQVLINKQLEEKCKAFQKTIDEMKQEKLNEEKGKQNQRVESETIELNVK